VRIRISLLRFLLEAAFLVLVAAAAGLARLEALWIGVVMFGAWLLVALVERGGSRRIRRGSSPGAKAEPLPEPAPAAQAEPEPRPEPAAQRAEPELEPAPEPALVAVPPPPREPEPEPAPEPELVATVVPLALHDPSPRTWNLWELERLAEETAADGRTEERALLLLHMRQFADASGDLPTEFDPLVRDAFGPGLAELVT
jgi:outer membrane biosynthesis protein TonB